MAVRLADTERPDSADFLTQLTPDKRTGKLSPARVRELIREGRNGAKFWHARSWRNRAFYDGDSWDAKDRKILEDRGQRPVVTNITAPTADLVIGLMACPQMDLSAKPISPSSVQSSPSTLGADAMAPPPVQAAANDGNRAKHGTLALKFVASRSDLDVKKRMAGEDAVIEGVGFLMSGAHVADRNSLSETVQVAYLPPRWCWYDLDATDRSLKDARYIGVSRWYSLVELVRLFPKHKAALESLRGKYAPGEQGKTTYHETLFESATEVALPPLPWGEKEWSREDDSKELDRKKDRVMVHELFYMSDEPASYYVDAQGQNHRYDPDDDTKIARIFYGLMLGTIKGLFTAMAPVVRVARMAGPIVLEDESTGSDLYPIHAFFWRRDRQGRPLSFVEQISDTQREINAREARAYFEAIAQRVQVGESWLDTHDPAEIEDIKEQVALPNGVILGDDIMPWMKDITDHLSFINLSRQHAREVAGVTEQLAGDSSGKSPKSADSQRFNALQSGITFESRRQDFVYSFRQLGYRLLWLWQKHHPEPTMVPVFNQMRGADDYISVQPEEGNYHIDIEAAPFNPTVRDKFVDTMLQLIAKLPPDAMLQAQVMLGALEAMDLPGVEVVEEALRGYLQRLQAGLANPEGAHQAAHRPRNRQPATAGKIKST